MRRYVTEALKVSTGTAKILDMKEKVLKHKEYGERYIYRRKSILVLVLRLRKCVSEA